jgi:nickel transport protein
MDRKTSAYAASILVATVLLLVSARPAIAHKVSVFAWVEKGKVEVEAYFAGGNPCKKCRIEVRDAKGKTLLTGLTDVKGRFGFAPPVVEDMRIVLFAGSGHKAEYSLSRNELAGLTPEPAAPSSPKTPQGVQDSPAVPPGEWSERLQALQTRVDAMSLQVARLRAEKGELTPAKVIAGLALILALTSLLAAWRRRRKE